MAEDDRIYPFGYGQTATSMMRGRSAEKNAALLLKHVGRGQSVLDVGCGPGSISVGIADAVAPGTVLGIDIEAAHIALAQEHAHEMGLNNCKFEVASIFELPLPDAGIDAIYGHTILMQFTAYDEIFAELRRVLKPGGIICFREMDLGSALHHSQSSALAEAQQLFRKSIFHNGGNPDIGCTLPRLIVDAGFDMVELSATYHFAATPDAARRQYASWIGLWEESAFPKQAIDLGWVSAGGAENLRDRLRTEADGSGNLAAIPYVEVVGRVN